MQKTCEYVALQLGRGECWSRAYLCPECKVYLKPWEECWKSESQNHLQSTKPPSLLGIHSSNSYFHLENTKEPRKIRRNGRRRYRFVYRSRMIAQHVSQFPHRRIPPLTGRYREPTRTYQRRGMTPFALLANRECYRISALGTDRYCVTLFRGLVCGCKCALMLRCRLGQSLNQASNFEDLSSSLYDSYGS
jgi:hypothetical protein